jgi:hypothetical protein
MVGDSYARVLRTVGGVQWGTLSGMEKMLYTLEVRTGGAWRSMGMLNESGLAYLLPLVQAAHGAENVTYRPALDGVDYIEVAE